MAIADWSATAADNDDSDADEGINLAEGMAPGGVNDSVRAIMAEIRQWYDAFSVPAATVVGNATVGGTFGVTGLTTLQSGLTLSNAAPVITLNETSVGNAYIVQDGGLFTVRMAAIGAAPALSIDVTNNVLFYGGTVATSNTAGAAVLNNGIVKAEVVSNPSLVLNRLTSNGSIMDINRQGVAVGSISVTGSATAYNTSSDYRLKTNVRDITTEEAAAFIDGLRPRRGNWLADGSNFCGFIAHELQTVSPSSVTGEKDAEHMQAIDAGTPEIIANVVAEVKALRARVAALEAQ